jgi:thymidylate synthase (FAD)
MMKIIEQSYEVLALTPADAIRYMIEIAGRTAYKSESELTSETGKDFARGIVKRGHLSVIEHAAMTVKFITDRGVTHEIVRHRLASFTQESTRYCNYGAEKFGNQLTFIRPVWADKGVIGEWPNALLEDLAINGPSFRWMDAMSRDEGCYLMLLEEGWAPQQARSVLPNSLKTEIVVTANLREWRHIFQLRAVEKAAHPQMRDLMIPLYNHSREYLPEIFDLGEPEV